MANIDDLVVTAALALCRELPIATELTTGMPVGSSTVTEPGAPGALQKWVPQEVGAVLTARVGRLGTAAVEVSGDIAVILPADLVAALKNSPLGELDVATAIEPALNAAVDAIGGGKAENIQELPLEVAAEQLLSGADGYIVPLTANDGGRAVIATLLAQVRAVDAHAISDATAAAGAVDSGSASSAPEPNQATSAAATSAGEIPTQPNPIPQSGTFSAADAPPLAAAARAHGLELLRDVAMEVTVEIGRTKMTVRDLLSLTPGAVVELDRAAGSPADLLVNGTLIARGEVVVVDEDFGIRITEILTPGARRESVGQDAAVGQAGAA